VSSSIISDIKVFDYNSDGNHDIIYRTALAGSPSNYVLLGNGDGTFKEPLELGKEFDFFKAREPLCYGVSLHVTLWNIPRPGDLVNNKYLDKK